MELERSNSTVVVSKTELFLCFSSSMKISSKSILSPGRPRDQPITLTTSLSRRLRTSGSIKGAQSPMFPNIAGKKRGSVFENPEPSSPKVTCIGQVRVKTKKQGRKMRTLSRRRNDAGEVSFRTGDSSSSSRQRNNNQRWVHLPLTICEALRGIGADFNCLFPCRSSSRNNNQNQNPNPNPNPKSSSCGAVFERWFVTIDDEGKGEREIELVVGDDETENTLLKERKRHPLEMFIEEDDDDDNEPRVSICIPPKNALLLMRCRSDPVQMEALSTRLFENPVHEQEEEEEEEEAAENGVSVVDVVEDDAETEEEMNEEDEKKGSGYSSEADAELVKLLESEDEEEEEEITDFSLLFSEESNSNLDPNDDEKTENPLETTSTHETSPSEEEDQRLDLSIEEEQEREIPENNKILPDCLLLMMCEPKLSMEVSKETWVCSTDFIRRPSEKPPIRNIPPLPPLPPAPAPAVIQPPRSSCTLPSMAAMIEQKLINAVGYEPFVLTRCKSEPMRTTAAGKFAPESCFWKNRKLEPLRRATLGIGAAGIGF